MKRLWLLLLLLVSNAAFGAASDTQPFKPIAAGTTTISCTSTSGATSLATPMATMAFLPDVQLELQNPGSVPIFVEVASSSAVTATVAASYPVLPGQAKVITVGPRVTHVACIVAVTTTNLYVTVGAGN